MGTWEQGMTCPSCLKAKDHAGHADYQNGCIGCQIRWLVHMTPEARAIRLDRVQFAYGYGARAEAVRLIEIEAARIKKLRRDAHDR